VLVASTDRLDVTGAAWVTEMAADCFQEAECLRRSIEPARRHTASGRLRVEGKLHRP